MIYRSFKFEGQRGRERGMNINLEQMCEDEAVLLMEQLSFVSVQEQI